jgi:TonB family protein
VPDEPAEPTPIKKDAADEQLYRCTANNAGALLSTGEAEEGPVFTGRELSTKAQILSKPTPDFPESARRRDTQGTVALRVVLAGTGKISTVKVLKGLPDGLTESAIRAACKIRFNPATKDGQPVSQAVMVEYNFALSDRIFGIPGGIPGRLPGRGRRWP